MAPQGSLAPVCAAKLEVTQFTTTILSPNGQKHSHVAGMIKKHCSESHDRAICWLPQLWRTYWRPIINDQHLLWVIGGTIRWRWAKFKMQQVSCPHYYASANSLTSMVGLGVAFSERAQTEEKEGGVLMQRVPSCTAWYWQLGGMRLMLQFYW